jgi:hypothetical protein
MIKTFSVTEDASWNAMDAQISRCNNFIKKVFREKIAS